MSLVLKAKASKAIVTPYADLINEFGSGQVQAQPAPQTEADILLGPPTPDKLEQSKR